MSLVVVYSVGEIKTKRETYLWHTGEEFLQMADQYDVVEIYADGDELTWLILKYNNLPWPRAPVVYWYGDMAKQIYMFLLTYGG